MFRKKNNFRSDEDLLINLKRKVIGGGLRTSGGQIIILFSRIVITAILARILTPDDFGLIAIVLPFVSFIDLLNDAGLSIATIQSKDLKKKQASTLFWLNIAISTSIIIIIIISSTKIAQFFNDMRLQTILPIFSISFIFSGAVMQHQSLLKRNMEYAELVKSQIIGNISGGLIGLFLAFYGFGYWALVYMYLSEIVVRSMFYFYFCKWIPSKPIFDFEVKKMLKFGGGILVSRISQYLSRNADNFLLGRYTSMVDLGIYSKPYQLILLPINQINAPINQIAIPALSRLKNDKIKFLSYYEKLLFIISMITIPMMALFFVSSEEIVGLALGEQWGRSVPVFKALIPGAFISVIGFVHGWALIPFGKGRRLMKISILGSMFTVSGFIVGVQWGVIGVAISFSITMIIKFIPQFLYAINGTYISISNLFNAVKYPVIFSLIAGALTYYFGTEFSFTSIFIRMIVKLFIFIISYVVLILLIKEIRKKLVHIILQIKLTLK